MRFALSVVHGLHESLAGGANEREGEKLEAIITGYESRSSLHGGMFYHIFFRDTKDGRYYLTHAFPRYKGKPIRNFKKWEKVMDLVDRDQEVTMDHLRIKKNNILNADSGVIIKNEQHKQKTLTLAMIIFLILTGSALAFDLEINNDRSAYTQYEEVRDEPNERSIRYRRRYPMYRVGL